MTLTTSHWSVHLSMKCWCPTEGLYTVWPARTRPTFVRVMPAITITCTTTFPPFYSTSINKPAPDSTTAPVGQIFYFFQNSLFIQTYNKQCLFPFHTCSHYCALQCPWFFPLRWMIKYIIDVDNFIIYRIMFRLIQSNFTQRTILSILNTAPCTFSIKIDIIH